VVGNFSGFRSLLANLNLSLKNEITWINSDVAESSDEILTIAIMVWAFSIKLMMFNQLAGTNGIEPPYELIELI
jgi:hypothetical protein